MEQAVIVHLKLSDQEFGSVEDRERAFAIEDLLERLLSDGEGVEYDGHELGDGRCRFFCYGGNADEIGVLVVGALGQVDLPRGSFMIKRYGPPGSPESRIEL